MNKQLEMVQEFHKTFNYARQLEKLEPTQVAARMSFIMEEFSEMLSAVAKEDSTGILDALIDMDYFALGTLDMMGSEVVDIPTAEGKVHFLPGALIALQSYVFLQEGPDFHVALSSLHWACVQECKNIGADYEKAFAEVQRSNMSKLDADGNPVYRDDGKIIKDFPGSTYSEPDLSQCFTFADTGAE